MSKKQWVNGLDDMSETDKAYLAGLIDGEGCLMLSQAQTTIRPKLQLIMTDQALVEWVASIWGTTVTSFAKYRALPHHKPQFRTTLTGERAVVAIEYIEPYMRLKRSQAHLFREWLALGDARLAKDRPRIRAAREELKIKMHALNDDRRDHTR